MNEKGDDKLKMDESMIKICGTVENVVYRNELNDYTVLEVIINGDELVSAVGTLPPTFEGEEIELVGSWTYHKEFGKQFSFVGYDKHLPDGVEGILQYLSSRTVKGIGPVTALKIVNRYGTDTFDVLENHPEWLVEIPGITMKKAKVISESFREQNGMREVMIFCKDFLGTGEITKVYKRLGVGAVGTITENPYILCDVSYGISFTKADAIAKSLGVSLDYKPRVLSGFKYILNTNAATHGHTCLPQGNLIDEAVSLLEISEIALTDMLSEFVLSGELSLFKDDNDVFIMTNEVAEGESYIARKLKSLSGEIEVLSASDISLLVEKAELKFGINFALLQREALFRAMKDGVMILTGGPGTGKTTVIKAMMSIFDSIGFEVALCAPTGRAAKRMSEATSAEAKTIHRMLEMERSTLNEVKFMRNEKNPLEERVVIVDEASMIDLSLMEALLRAMRRGSRLILIGDFNQLPSVGAGNVLSDLIESKKISTVCLTEIFRQSRESLIVTNAHKINAGEAPILTSADSDFFFVKRENEYDIAKTVSSLITERLPRAYGEEIRDKIQVIAPSKKGLAGIEVLNTELQKCINPEGKFKKEKAAHGVIFREGDRVMQTVNNYEIIWEKNGVEGSGIFNGDIGRIERIDLHEKCAVISFEDRVATYGFDLLEELELAYAITVHKSQGSEYPVVIIPMYSCAPMLMTRNLLYTAVTRAKKMVILVGRSDIPGKMVNNNLQIKRFTLLMKRICLME